MREAALCITNIFISCSLGDFFLSVTLPYLIISCIWISLNIFLVNKKFFDFRFREIKLVFTRIKCLVRIKGYHKFLSLFGRAKCALGGKNFMIKIRELELWVIFEQLWKYQFFGLLIILWLFNSVEIVTFRFGHLLERCKDTGICSKSSGKYGISNGLYWTGWARCILDNGTCWPLNEIKMKYAYLCLYPSLRFWAEMQLI